MLSPGQFLAVSSGILGFVQKMKFLQEIAMPEDSTMPGLAYLWVIEEASSLLMELLEVMIIY